MISKNTVGRSPSGLVKICSSTPCAGAGTGRGLQGQGELASSALGSHYIEA